MIQSISKSSRVATVGPAVFDCYVLAIDIADVFEALAKSAQTLRHPIRRSGVEESDHGQCMLRARRERPCGRRAAEQCDERAPGGQTLGDQRLSNSAIPEIEVALDVHR
jgi:hypothetical protein